MGKWIYDEPVHKHDHPTSDSKSKPVGSIWECSCGEWFRLLNCTYSGDQRESWYSYTWRLLIKGDNVTLNDGRVVAVGREKAVSLSSLGYDR